MELKELLTYLGVPEDVEDLDAFKESFGTTFIKRDMVAADNELAGKIWAKKAGTLQKSIEKLAKSVGFELPDPTFRDVKHEETINKLVEFIQNDHAGKVETLTEQIKTGGKGTPVEDSKEYKKIKKELDEKVILLGNVTQEFETYKDGHTKEKKGSLIKTHFEESKGKVKLVKDISPLIQKGYISEFNEEYEIVSNDDNTEAYPVLKSNGQRPKSSKKASEFATTAELLEQLAGKHKILDMTPEQKKGEIKPKPNSFEPIKDKGDGVYEKQIHPEALKAEREEAEWLAQNRK